ncbi:glutathione S-transferase 1 [Ditylenchus destructor]|nr:glutathione S-transferase 1 [Ditylenchus destructor]
MVQYKLTYFDVRGLAEMSRCIMAYAGAEYEDHRITHEQWPALKSTMPYEQLPLAGKTDVESALLDSIMDLQKDFQNEVQSYFMVAMGRKEGDKDKLYKEVFVPAAERHFPRCIKLLNESGSGFYGKSGVSWVDFHLASSILTLKHFAPDMVKKYPELQSHCDRVHALPQLQSYLSKRKETQV